MMTMIQIFNDDDSVGRRTMANEKEAHDNKWIEWSYHVWHLFFFSFFVFIFLLFFCSIFFTLCLQTTLISFISIIFIMNDSITQWRWSNRLTTKKKCEKVLFVCVIDNLPSWRVVWWPVHIPYSSLDSPVQLLSSFECEPTSWTWGPSRHPNNRSLLQCQMYGSYCCCCCCCCSFFHWCYCSDG